MSEDSIPLDVARTEAEWSEEMEKVDASPLAIAKKVFIIAKTAFILYQTIKAAKAWRRSNKLMAGPAFICLLFSGLIVLAVCVYKFTSKKIAPLVALQAMSHYLCFCIFHVLLGYVQCAKFDIREKLLKAFWIFHVIWWVLIAIAAQNSGCSKEDFYPDSFLMTNCFSFGIYVMVYILHNKDFLLEWSEGEEVAKNLFVKQMERYLGFYTFVIEWHLFELVLGKCLDTFTDSIMCSEDGSQWIYASGKGNLFMMLHIIGTMMGTGMARAVFIKTVKDEGFFGGVEEQDSDNDEPVVVNKTNKVKVEAKKTR